MKKLYFIRHGLSVDNKNRIYSGRADCTLAPEGILQMKQAAVEMMSLEIDGIVSSPFKRTVESALIIAKQLRYPVSKIYINDLFSERQLGTAEGQPYQPGMLTDDLEGIEKTADLLIRARKALDWIYETDSENIIVVSHGSFGRALRATLNPSMFSYNDGPPFINGQLVKLL